MCTDHIPDQSNQVLWRWNPGVKNFLNYPADSKVSAAKKHYFRVLDIAGHKQEDYKIHTHTDIEYAVIYREYIHRARCTTALADSLVILYQKSSRFLKELILMSLNIPL